MAARRFADIPWPDLHVNPGLLAVAAGLSLLGYAFKAYGWERLFAADERPQPLALAAAMEAPRHGARTSREIRRRRANRDRPPVPGLPGGREGARLSLFMLGLVDAAALAPLALIAAALPGHSLALRLGLLVLVGVGLAAQPSSSPRPG